MTLLPPCIHNRQDCVFFYETMSPWFPTQFNRAGEIVRQPEVTAITCATCNQRFPIR